MFVFLLYLGSIQPDNKILGFSIEEIENARTCSPQLYSTRGPEYERLVRRSKKDALFASQHTISKLYYTNRERKRGFHSAGFPVSACIFPRGPSTAFNLRFSV